MPEMTDTEFKREVWRRVNLALQRGKDPSDPFITLSLDDWKRLNGIISEMRHSKQIDQGLGISINGVTVLATPQSEPLGA